MPSLFRSLCLLSQGSRQVSLNVLSVEIVPRSSLQGFQHEGHTPFFKAAEPSGSLACWSACQVARSLGAWMARLDDCFASPTLGWVARPTGAAAVCPAILLDRPLVVIAKVTVAIPALVSASRRILEAGIG